MADNEIVGWHYRINVHEFQQTPRDSEEQGNLVCCSPWGCKKTNTNYQPDNNKEGYSANGSWFSFRKVTLAYQEK